MATRRELIRVVGEQYRGASRQEQRRILDEFVSVTGYHRKHALRVLNKETAVGGSTARPRIERIKTP